MTGQMSKNRSIDQVIAVENNMRTPKSFNKVMSLAMTIICVLYAVFGFVGYLKYGGDCKGSVTLNADQTEMYVRLNISLLQQHKIQIFLHL